MCVLALLRIPPVLQHHMNILQYNVNSCSSCRQICGLHIRTHSLTHTHTRKHTLSLPFSLSFCHTQTHVYIGWLQSVGLIKLQVSFADCSLFSQVSFAKETCNLIDPTNRSHHISTSSGSEQQLKSNSRDIYVYRHSHTHTHTVSLSLSPSLSLSLPFSLAFSLSPSLSLFLSLTYISTS